MRAPDGEPKHRMEGKNLLLGGLFMGNRSRKLGRLLVLAGTLLLLALLLPPELLPYLLGAGLIVAGVALCCR